jgi:hypothetical protein
MFSLFHKSNIIVFDMKTILQLKLFFTTGTTASLHPLSVTLLMPSYVAPQQTMKIWETKMESQQLPLKTRPTQLVLL